MPADPVSSESTILSGTIADKYRIEGVIGVGGMGIVHSAIHLHLGEKVAIKTLRPEIALRSDAVARFLREARASIRLRGEHTVRVLDAGLLPSGTAYIVMELLNGTDFAAVLRRGRLPMRATVDHVLQACTAIAEAHSLGIIHRDLKPANLFLTRRADGTPCVKVLDFGISKIVEEGIHDPLSETAPSSEATPALRATDLSLFRLSGALYPDALTSTRATLGSPRYMSPEQISSARDVDARADVWGMGCILYELLEGVAPFAAQDAEVLRASVLEEAPQPLSQVPRELAAVVLRCLEKDREQRFADVAALARALVPFGSATSEAAASCIARILSGHGQRSEASVPFDTRSSAFSFGATRDEGEGDRPVSRSRLRAVGFAAALLGAVTITTLGVRAANAPRPAILVNAAADAAPTIVTRTAEPRVEPAPSPVLQETSVAITPTVRAPGPAPTAASRARTARPPAVARPPSAAPSPAPVDPLAVEGGELFDVRK